MGRKQPTQQSPPAVQRVRIRYAKRGRLRFSSHRDFARALERAVQRAALPVAWSSGFHPHPKISYLGAAPTGVASEAEYAEIALAQRLSPAEVGQRLDAVLPDGLDVVEAVEAITSDFPARITGSRWRLELDGVSPGVAAAAVEAFTATPEILVERLTKSGRQAFDLRQSVVQLTVTPPDEATTGENIGECAILEAVVRHATPSVRPDDILAGLRLVADLEPPVAARAVRLVQGTLSESGEIADPLAADRAGATSAEFVASS